MILLLRWGFRRCCIGLGLIRMSVGLCMLGRGEGEGNTLAAQDGV